MAVNSEKLCFGTAVVYFLKVDIFALLKMYGSNIAYTDRAG